MRVRIFAMASAALLLFGVMSVPASAQNGARWRARTAAQHRPNGAAKPRMRAMEGLPPKWLQKLQDMPPAEQERFLENNERFQSLPPLRQEQIRRNLRRWDNLTPEQKRAARSAEQALERMTPEQRAYVRNTLLPRWQALPMARRLVIRRHLAMLSRMSPSTQQDALKDPKFLEGLSPDEREMLRTLNSLRNPNSPSQ